MAEDSVLSELVAYAETLSYEDLDAETIETAKVRIFDTIGCALLASDSKAVDEVAQYAGTKRGERTARVLGTDQRSGIEYASMANAAAMRFLDWNDTFLSAEAAHPSCNLGPLLAIGDAEGASGKDLLAAAVLAYEIQCELCQQGSFTDNGFDHVNYGLLSVPLAGGALLGLTPTQLTHAVNIAVAGHISLLQSRLGTLTEWKGIAFGNAARNGVVGIELAERGVQGPSPIVTGERGLNHVVEPDLRAEELTLDGEFLINRTHLKPYPICHHILGAVDAVFRLVEEEGIGPSDVRSIEVDTYDIAVYVTGGDEKWRPTTRSTADHSLPYCVARALIDGKLGPEQLAEDKLGEEDVVELMDKIEVREDESLTQSYSETFSHRVRIHTDAGTREARVDHPRGHYENPLSMDEVERKITRHSSFPPALVKRLRSEIEALESVDDVSTVVDTVGAVAAER